MKDLEIKLIKLNRAKEFTRCIIKDYIEMIENYKKEDNKDAILGIEMALSQEREYKKELEQQIEILNKAKEIISSEEIFDKVSFKIGKEK